MAIGLFAGDRERFAPSGMIRNIDIQHACDMIGSSCRSSAIMEPEMKKLGFAIGFALAVLPLSALPKVAVLDITAQKGIDSSVVVPVTESIMEQLVNTRAYVVLDRAYIEQVLKEQEFDVSSMVSDTLVAKAGQYVGADYVVTGKVQVLGSAYFLVAKMIEVKTGVIVSQSSTQGTGELTALLDMARTVGKSLAVGSPISPLEPAQGGAASAGAAATWAAATAAAQAPAANAAKKIKAGFVMPEWIPEGAENKARMMSVRQVEKDCADWLEVDIAYGVKLADLPAALDRLAGQDKCDIILDCAGGGQVPRFIEAAKRYPDVKFEALERAPGWEAVPNLGLYNWNWNWHLYLEGIVAGSMTKSQKVAYLGQPLGDPESNSKANLFALGVKAANPKATVFVTILPGFDPAQAEKAASALLAQGCDFFNGTDNWEVLKTLLAATRGGKRTLTFLHETSFGDLPEIAVSGPTLDMAPLLRRELLSLRGGQWKKEDYSTYETMRFGGAGPAFNPAFMAELGSKQIKTPDLGAMPLLELLDRRSGQIIAGEFVPFSGPIKDQKGKLRVAAGARRNDWEFTQNQDWLLDNAKTLPPTK
jgi:basic membrane protein A and related proteins